MNKFRLISPVLAVLALLLTTSASRADLEIALQEAGVNGGAITVVATAADFTSVTFTGTYGSFSVKVQGGSADNGATLSDLLQSTTSVTNTTGSTATLHLWVTETDYTLPPGDLLQVQSSLGGSVTIPTLGLTGIYQGYADKGNNLFGVGDFTTGLQSATFVSPGSYATGTATGNFSRIDGNPYSLTSVVNFTLSGGGHANYAGQENVFPSPAPAPAGLLLALTALPLLGAHGWLRRRKAVKAA
jgi:hypothetical protein